MKGQKKPFKLALFIVACIILGALLSSSVYMLAKSALGNKDTIGVDCAKQAKGTEHTTTITGGRLTMNEISAEPCDLLTIVNADNQLRLMAFGEHDKHTPYGNTGERTLLQGQRMTVTLDHLGTYLFHDHLDDGVVGMLAVVE